MNFDSKKASQYENLARKAVFGYDQLFVLALSLLAEKQKENANVLITGCGTGMELITIGNTMLNWRLTGVDPSVEMIKISQAKIDYHALNDRITLHNGFVESLPETEDYDAATLIFVLRFITDSKSQFSLFQNIAKRLKSSAKLIIIDQYGDPGSENFKTLSNAWRNFMKLSGLSAELVNKIMVQAIEQSFISERDLKGLLMEAGFVKINQFYKSFVHGGWVVQKI